MKRIYLISAILIFILGCNNKDANTELDSSIFCDNEINLLNSFDTIPTLIGDFQFINDSLKGNISNLFMGDVCCSDLRFNIIHPVDSIDSVKISLNYFYNCEDCSNYSRERNMVIILLNSKGQVQFEGWLIEMDSIQMELNKFYNNIGEPDFFPDSYDKVNIAIQWDIGVSKENFTKFINQVIFGYLNFVKEFSRTEFNKELCQLNQVELSKVSMLIPLNIELPVFEIIDMDELKLWSTLLEI